MQNNYRKTLCGVLTMFVIVISFTSCKKFLDRQPLGVYTLDNYPYPTGGGPYDQFIYGAYAEMRSYYASCFGFIGAVSIRSDDADKGSALFDGADYGQVAVDNFTLNGSYGIANELWLGYYSLIEKCNIVLDQVGKDSSNTLESYKTQARAEAKLIRGYAYFTLVRLFGNIPLIDTLKNVAVSNIPQSDPSVIYGFIEKDLQYASVNLPASWDAKFIGRATKGAANGLLAKVFLYQKKWTDAMAFADMAINSGLYDFSTPYDKIFTEEGENSKESVFEIQCFADANHQQDFNFGSQYANIQGVRGVANQDLGWGFNSPSIRLEAAYETGDPRKNSTILYCPSPFPTKYGEVFPAEPNPRYNMKVYTNPAIRNTVGDRFGWWTNIRILRYADVVLIYAEAANELGQTSGALQKLEWVRSRARAGNNSILPPVTTTNQSLLRLAIQQERRIELAMEHERFFDIVRWGIAADIMHAAGKLNYTNGRDELLPIPQIQIDLSKGVLHQNPGY